ncbi:hypothetical protein JW979_09540 [bacterium]|nr:hypothetical protein [candidate division CSSED10-310 bacterium]
MKRFLVRTLIFFCCTTIVVLAGDWLNLPLWPFDYLKPRVPVEIRSYLDGFDEETTQQMLHHGGGAVITVYSDNGKEVFTERTGGDGVLRKVLPAGRFTIHSVLTVVFNGEFYYFSAGSKHGSNLGGERELSAEVCRGRQQIPIVLKHIAETSETILNRLLKGYLQEGDLNGAAVLSRNINPEVTARIDRMIDLRNHLDVLPYTAYNSSIILLMTLDELIASECDCHHRKINTPGEIVVIDSRLNALRRSRDKVVQTYLELISEFFEDDKKEAALEQWMQLKNNDELFPDESDIQEDYWAAIDFYKDIMPDIENDIIEDIREDYAKSVDLYKQGDLSTSRIHFTSLLLRIRNLQLQDVFTDEITEIQWYLDDIALLFTASEAIRNNNFTNALLMLDTVVHSSDLVKRRIDEVERLMFLKGIEPENFERTEH